MNLNVLASYETFITPFREWEQKKSPAAAGDFYLRMLTYFFFLAAFFLGTAFFLAAFFFVAMCFRILG